MGRKRGMVQIFDEKGAAIACTLVQVEENVVVQVKSSEKDGYCATQLGFEEIKTRDPRTLMRRVSKPLFGHFRKAGLSPRRFLKEFPQSGNHEVGQKVGVSDVKVGQYIDVQATSKGKGYQGVMKLYNFRGIGSSHGAGPVHRHGGSRGQRSTPGRVFPGNKAAGRMGGDRISVQNLRVIAVDEEQGLVCLRGAVPGSRGALITLRPAVKKQPKNA